MLTIVGVICKLDCRVWLTTRLTCCGKICSSTEFRAQFQRKVPLFLEVPEFLCELTQCGIGRRNSRKLPCQKPAWCVLLFPKTDFWQTDVHRQTQGICCPRIASHGKNGWAVFSSTYMKQYFNSSAQCLWKENNTILCKICQNYFVSNIWYYSHYCKFCNINTAWGIKDVQLGLLRIIEEAWGWFQQVEKFYWIIYTVIWIQSSADWRTFHIVSGSRLRLLSFVVFNCCIWELNLHCDYSKC